MDWKEELGKAKQVLTPAKKRKPKEATFKRLKELTENWRQVHPRDMLIKLSPVFNAISHKYAGGWPTEDTKTVDPEFVVEKVGDLIKMVLVRNGSVYMRTNQGFFRFFNKEV